MIALSVGGTSARQKWAGRAWIVARLTIGSRTYSCLSSTQACTSIRCSHKLLESIGLFSDSLKMKNTLLLVVGAILSHSACCNALPTQFAHLRRLKGSKKSLSSSGKGSGKKQCQEKKVLIGGAEIVLEQFSYFFVWCCQWVQQWHRQHISGRIWTVRGHDCRLRNVHIRRRVQGMPVYKLGNIRMQALLSRTVVYLQGASLRGGRVDKPLLRGVDPQPSTVFGMLVSTKACTDAEIIEFIK